MARLKYPLSNRDQYRGKIKFTRYKALPPSLTFGDVAARQAQNSTDNIINFGETTVDPNAVSLTDIPFTTFHGGGYEKTNDVVELHLPAGVQIADAVNFDNKDIGIRGVAAMNASQTEGGVSAQQLAGLAVPLGDIQNISQMIQNDNTGRAARTLASGLASAVGDRTGSTVSSIAQAAVNPNTRSVFQGVPIRKFNFAFEMKASSPQEQQHIEAIVDHFRSHLYPKSITVGGVPIGLEFPDRYMIKMMYDGKQVGVDFLQCHLEGVNTTFNGQSQAFYNDGGFTQVDLSLMFTEVRALTQEDIKLGVTSTGKTRRDLNFLGAIPELLNISDDINRIRNIVNVFS